jgi:hypothetical protein
LGPLVVVGAGRTSTSLLSARARSTIEEVKPSHISMVSHPNAVTTLVETAGATT